MTSPLWVFGYGSLLWNPGFPVAETRIARLHGWHRSFCMTSIHHRGTEEDPGLVLALDAAEDAYCDGLALRAEAGTEQATITYLRERELISSAYVETRQEVEFRDGARQEEVLTYVINRDHVQYCQYPLERQAEIIADAHGGRGPNDEYLFNTAAHLAELGIGDAEMEDLVAQVKALKGIT
ncbi:gamma-glutamylcyclotransferase [Rhodobacterales bacterium HKCCE4037]|nr:gamma-glutamylcyclotransferase [Rhodobacterales bacterium HKCCE4037]